MNLFAGVPFIIPDPAAEQRENAKIGMQAASMFGESFRAAQSNKTQNRQIDLQNAQWEAGAKQRQANLDIAIAGAKKAGIEADNAVIIAENNKKMTEKQGEFAALNEQVEQTGWTNPYSKDMYYNFLTRNPEFVNTQYTKAMEDKFAKAEAVERMREYNQQKIEATITKAKIQQEGKIDPIEKANLDSQVKALQNNDDLRDNPDKLASEIDKTYKSFQENGNKVVRRQKTSTQEDNTPRSWQDGPNGFRFRIVN